MRPPKFNFVPEKQVENKNETGGYYVSITKSGFLYFPKEVIHVYDLAGKYIKLFVDREKKALGWRVVDETTTPEVLNDCRVINSKNNGSAIFSIGKLLSSMGVDSVKVGTKISYIGMPMSNVPVEKYRAGYLEGDIYYISLSDYSKKEKVV